MLKQLLICTLSVFYTISGNAQDWKKVSILPQSKIYLNGVSNVNTFACQVCNPASLTELNLHYKRVVDRLVFEDNEYRIPIDNFLCENSRMTEDLKKALKMADYPQMFLELESLHDLADTILDAEAELKITLAGKSNSYHLSYHPTRISQNLYRIDIKRIFNMYDFDIEPPTALFGLVKVKEQIEIELELYILVAE